MNTFTLTITQSKGETFPSMTRPQRALEGFKKRCIKSNKNMLNIASEMPLFKKKHDFKLYGHKCLHPPVDVSTEQNSPISAVGLRAAAQTGTPECALVQI